MSPPSPGVGGWWKQTTSALPVTLFLCFILARAGVWVSFNGLLALLFSLFYVIREFDKILHRG